MGRMKVQHAVLGRTSHGQVGQIAVRIDMPLVVP
jgi:hypothetical protein